MGSGKPGLAVFAGRPCKARCVGTLEPGADMAPPLTASAETVERENKSAPFFQTGKINLTPFSVGGESALLLV
jgi:hypothetical protein